ncbi:MAG: serine hydrolase [Gemmatimonadota bacterium]|nr:serine hydrolase [Gemmatimonadota bacterium]
MKRPSLRGLLVIALSGCGPAPAAQVRDADEGPDLSVQIDALVTEEALSHGVPGVAVTVVSDGVVTHLRGYGRADLETGRAVNAATPFNVASITKPFTGATVQLLAREGAVGLDEPAATYLDDLPTRYAAITVRQLLTHTSGIARDLRTENLDDPSADEYRARLDTATASAEPGRRFEYSNTGFTVLGWLVEAVEGRPLGEVYGDRMLVPAGLLQARYREPLEAGPERARPYDVDSLGRATPAPYVSGGHGSGGLSMSAADFAAFGRSLQDGSLLPGLALEAAWTPGRLADGSQAAVRMNADDDGYGMGWFLTSVEGRRLVTHGGGISGYSANLYHFPEQRLTIAVIANAKARDDGRAPVDGLARKIASLCFERDDCRRDTSWRTVAEEIRSANRAFSEAFVAGDTTAIRSMYLEDGLALPPNGRAVVGASGIARLFRTPTDGNQIHHALYSERFQSMPGAVVELGTWYNSGTRRGEDFRDSGRYVLSWFRTLEGWRIAADAW